jgi:hypothetical protein
MKARFQMLGRGAKVGESAGGFFFFEVKIWRGT